MNAAPGRIMLLAGALALVAAQARPLSAAPGLINYQGRLTDDAGQPITTAVNVTFTFWDAPTTGTQLGGAFTDTDTVTPSAEGLFATLIGDDPTSLVPQSIFATDAVWLNVNVEGDDLTPRTRMTSSPYSINSASAETARHADTATTADLALRALSVTGNLTHPFPVASGKTVATGEVVALKTDGTIWPASGNALGYSRVFESEDSSNDIAAVALTNDTFVIAYDDNANPDHGEAILGTVTDGVLDLRTKTGFSSAPIEQINIIRLSDTQFVIAYRKLDAPTYRGKAIVGTLTSGSLSFGPPAIFSTGVLKVLRAAPLSPTSFVVAYRDDANGDLGTAAVGIVTGDTIAFGNEYPYMGAAWDLLSLAALSTSKFMVCFADPDNSGRLTGRVGSITGNAIAYGSEHVFTLAGAATHSATALSPSKVVVAYTNDDGSQVVVATVAGSALSSGAPAAFTHYKCRSYLLARLSSSSFLLAYSAPPPGYTAPLNGYLVGGAVSGSSVAYGSTVLFCPNWGGVSDGGPPIVALGGKQGALIYNNPSDDNHGTITLFGDLENENSVALGIASESGSAGQQVNVILGGISDKHTNLATGQIHHANPDGTITTEQTPVPIGLALSPTQLLLDIER